MGCLMSSRKRVTITSVAPAPQEAKRIVEAPAAVGRETVVIQDVGEDEITVKRSRPGSDLKMGDSDSVQAAAQAATRKAENKRRTGLSNVAKPASTPAQIGLMTGMDFSMQCDFPALPGQVSPRFSRPVLPGEEIARQGVKNGISFRPARSLRSDDPDESIDCLPPALEREPPSNSARKQHLPPWSAFSTTTSNNDSEKESPSLDTPKQLTNSDDGGGDHIEQVAVDDENVGGKKQSQGDSARELKQAEHFREDSMLQLLSSSDACRGLFSGDHSVCNLPSKPVTYSGICKASIAQEFHFSLEDILQRQLPCNSPEVMELAAMTGTEGAAVVRGKKANLPLPKDYTASWNNCGVLLSREAGADMAALKIKPQSPIDDE